MNQTSNKEKILTITSAGICLALAFVLSQIKLFEMPMGGTVSPASTLPIIVFCMAFGPVWGLAVAFIFACLQLINGYLVTPLQVMLDYIFGYLCLGFTGFAALKLDVRTTISNPIKRFTGAGLKKAVIFTLVAYVTRWICSVLSGVIFYAEYAPEGMNPWVYSMIYNGSFLSLDLVFLLIVMAVLYVVLMKAYKKSSI